MKRAWLYSLAALSTVCAAGLYTCLSARPPYHDHFASSGISEWRQFGGQWRVDDGVLRNLSAGRGDKMLVGSEGWTDYEVETDLRLDSDSRGTSWGDAGILFRVTNPYLGVDDYDGFYLGIEPDENGFILGRVTHSWQRVRVIPLAQPFAVGRWYRIRMLVQGCHIDATLQPAGSPSEAPTRLTYFDERCAKTAGNVGVRVYSVRASWRNFSVRPL